MNNYFLNLLIIIFIFIISKQNKWVKENMMTCPVVLTTYLSLKKSKKQANGKKIVINNQKPTISNQIITRSRKIQFPKPNLQDSILLIS